MKWLPELTFEIMMKLLKTVLNQGYKVYMGNCYTSLVLMKALSETLENRRRANEKRPAEHVPSWASTANRGH
jgi:hypothetical protein